MITKAVGYKSSDGVVHLTLEDAQIAEVREIFRDGPVKTCDALDVAATIVRNAEKIIDILSTTPTSKVRGRKINGATRKPRKPQPAEATLPLEAK